MHRGSLKHHYRLATNWALERATSASPSTDAARYYHTDSRFVAAQDCDASAVRQLGWAVA